MTISSERNKTIAFVSNSAWSVYNFRLDVIRHLRSRGYHIIIIAPDDEYSSFLVELGCRFIPIDFNNKTENPFVDYFFFRRLKQLYRIHHPDFIFHYVANKYVTFDCQSKEIGYQFSLYFLVTCASLVGSLGVMELLVTLLSIETLYARMLTTILILVPNYLLHKYITFSKKIFLQSR